MTKNEKEMIYKGPAIRLITANGPIKAEDRFDIPFAPIGVLPSAVVLEKSPSVAAVGRLCMLDDYEFIWKNRTEPYLRNIVTDKRCETDLEHFVPFLRNWLDQNSGRINALPGTADCPATTTTSAIDTKPPPGLGEQPIGLPPGLEVAPPPASTFERLKKEALSLRHRLLHFPKNPHCKVCLRAKLYKSQSRRKDPKLKKKYTHYGELLLADHFILSETEAGMDGERASLNTLDVGTMFTDVGPAKSKSAMDSDLNSSGARGRQCGDQVLL